MNITVSAVGRLKKYLPEKPEVELKASSTLNDLKAAIGIKSGAGYVVNGKIASGDDTLHDGDSVQFIMIVGAG